MLMLPGIIIIIVIIVLLLLLLLSPSSPLLFSFCFNSSKNNTGKEPASKYHEDYIPSSRQLSWVGQPVLRSTAPPQHSHSEGQQLRSWGLLVGFVQTELSR